jgi:hypothetical protein
MCSTDDLVGVLRIWRRAVLRPLIFTFREFSMAIILYF